MFLSEGWGSAMRFRLTRGWQLDSGEIFPTSASHVFIDNVLIDVIGLKSRIDSKEHKGKCTTYQVLFSRQKTKQRVIQRRQAALRAELSLRHSRLVT